jgi:hypothetical protein
MMRRHRPAALLFVSASVFFCVSSVAFFCVSSVAAITAPRATPDDSTVATSALDTEIRTFLQSELTAHLKPINSLDPPPARVNGALTTGEFSWGTFMRSLAAYGQLSGTTTLADRDLARTIGEIGLLEVRLGGTRFSQLYAALSLRHYGVDLDSNRIWRALSSEERDAWRKLVDVTRFYDPVKKQVINLPENYLGVAARIAAMAWEMKLLQDRAALDSLLDRAAVQFTRGALYADDSLPTGRYDRYSNEYARYVWEAAQIAGRKDLLDALRPSLKRQMHLWWDLLAPDGYGYPWGRSLGVVSYLDTLEIAGFLAIHPEFRPAALPQLAAAYHAAWRYLRGDYKDDRHLLSLYDYGRGNFAYISIDREWQQTVGFLGKLAHAHIQLTAGLQKDGVAAFPRVPTLPAASRFEFFRTDGRQAGVWVVRDRRMRFALPITTATKPGVADYLPAPHGLPGIASPVEQVMPALVPFIELPDGRTIVAADGADEISPSADGRGVRATWTRWARIGGKATEWVEDSSLRTTVEWRLNGTTLVRTERLEALKPMKLARWRVAIPSTAESLATEFDGKRRIDTLTGREGTLRVSMFDTTWPCAMSVRVAGGDTPQGRGARGAVPLHLVCEARDVSLQPGTAAQWTLSLEVK